MGFKFLGVVVKLRREIKKNKNLWKKKKCINLYEKTSTEDITSGTS